MTQTEAKDDDAKSKTKAKAVAEIAPPTENWWELKCISLIFNLPRVNAHLERLMGSNVVHLTDRKYMMELRRRINEDFNEMQNKRIQNREAKEMERQRKLLMEGKLVKCPKELSNHPVFMVNQTTNTIVLNKRAKLKSKRERNAERLIRQGKRWERERLHYEEKEREREAEMKVREMELLAAEGKLNETIESRGVRVLGVKNREYTEVEKDLADFLNTENELMANRLKPKETKFDPYTKDLRLVDAKRRMSEASRPKLKSLVAKLTQLNKQSDQPCASQTTIVGEQEIQRQEQQLSVTDNDNSVGGEQVQRTATLDHDDALHSDALDADAEPVIISLHRDDESLSSTDSSADDLDDENVAKIDESKLGQTYVDPMIAKLRLAENVHDMYALAEQIVGGIANQCEQENSSDSKQDLVVQIVGGNANQQEDGNSLSSKQESVSQSVDDDGEDAEDEIEEAERSQSKTSI